MFAYVKNIMVAKVLRTFKKIKKRYCGFCQFQDRFDLILLNQVKFDIKKLVCLYNEILIALVEIKKICKLNNGEYPLLEKDIFCILIKMKKIIWNK